MPPAITVDSEHARGLRITARLGRRLAHALKTQPDGLPDCDWRETYASYLKGLRVIATRDAELKRIVDDKGEHRALTDEEYEEEMRTVCREAVLDASDDELRKLLAERNANRRAELALPDGTDARVVDVGEAAQTPAELSDPRATDNKTPPRRTSAGGSTDRAEEARIDARKRSKAM
jgi:hypothetical protein